MAQEERTGRRDLTFNKWHRMKSIKRFIGEEDAKVLYAQDIDLVEKNYSTGQPYIFHELAVYNPGCMMDKKDTKTLVFLSSVLKEKGYDSEVWLTFYEKSQSGEDIKRLFTRRVFPDEEKEFSTMQPEEYAVYLNETVKRLKQKENV